MNFQKLDLSAAEAVSILTELCELCWQKIDEFNQFCVQVENIHTSYNRQFMKDNGCFSTTTTFEDPNQFFSEIEKIHNEFASKLFEDKKTISYIEPFCMINVDDDKTVNDTSQKASDFDGKLDESPRIKDRYKGQVEENYDERLINTDILSTESTSGYLGISDFEDDISLGYEDDDEDDDDADAEDGDDNMSSDSSYSEPREKRRKSAGKMRKSQKSSQKAKGKSSKSSQKKHSKKISVTTFNVNVNVLDEDNKRLLSYVQMKCDVCSDDREFESFSEIQNHFLDTHNTNGYIICCNRKFRRIGRVLQHCTWHDNPEAFKCDTCNKCFQDNVCLRDHVTSMHIPVDERRFQCDQCSRLFAKQHLLNTHLKMKHTVKEERPFVCSEGECGQRFVLPAYLRLHVEKVHNKSDSR